MSELRIESIVPWSIAEIEYFKTAYEWYDDKPRFLKTAEAVWRNDFFEYIGNANRKKQTDFAVFDGDEFIALFTLVEVEPGQCRVDIDCKRGTEFETMLNAGEMIKQHFFENGGQSVFAETASFNRPIVILLELLGFTATNISIFKGVLRNKLIEWQFFELVKPKIIAN